MLEKADLNLSNNSKFKYPKGYSKYNICLECAGPETWTSGLALSNISFPENFRKEFEKELLAMTSMPP